MMYVWDFFGFLFHELSALLTFCVAVYTVSADIVRHLLTLVSSLPGWLSIPFGSLILIAVLFRVSQFIPTIGGASS